MYEPCGVQSASGEYSGLLSLPPELTLRICLHLPLSDIARLRLVDRTLHDFVQANADHISNPIHSRELIRLRDFISYHDIYKGNVNILEAFSRWAELRGWTDFNTQMDINTDEIPMRAFSNHWAVSKGGSNLSISTEECLFFAVSMLRSTHHYYHERDPSLEGWEPMFGQDAFIDHMNMYPIKALNFTDAEYLAMYNELRYTPEGRLSGPHCQSPQKGDPDYVRVSRYGPRENLRILDGRSIPLDIEMLDSSQGMSAPFSVPRLPLTKQFTYVIESEWARHIIRNILHLEREGMDIDPLIRAAGIQELRFY